MNASGRDMEKAEDLMRVYATAPADEPPSALDDRILAEASRAAEKPTPESQQSTWGPPLAAAAVLVLGVFVVFQMQDERPVLESAGMVSSGQRSADTIALTRPSQSSATTNTGTTGVTPSGRLDSTSPVNAGHYVPQPAAGVAGAAPSAPQRSEPAIVADAIDAGNASREARSETAQAAMLSGRDRPSARPERPTAARSLAAGASPAPPMPELAMRKAADEAPEVWLRHLAELKQQGRTKAFDEGLAEFRKRHPDYRIPEALLTPR